MTLSKMLYVLTKRLKESLCLSLYCADVPATLRWKAIEILGSVLTWQRYSPESTVLTFLIWRAQECDRSAGRTRTRRSPVNLE